MIRRARRQFVLSAMGAMGVCVLALILVINLANYAKTQRRRSLALAEMATAVEAVLSAEPQEEPQWRVESYVETATPMPTATPAPTAAQTQEQPPHFFGEDGGRKGHKEQDKEKAQERHDDAAAAPQTTPAAREEQIVNHYYYYYETGKPEAELRHTALNQYAGRLFIVTLSGDDATADMSDESALSDETVIALGRRMRDTGKTQGFLDDYRFLIKPTEDGSRVYFLDCTIEEEAMRSLLALSCLVGLGGLAMAFLFVLRMSRRAIWPLQESMERQKRFITDAGHELKTPLAVIGANMDILSMDLGENEWITGTQKQLRRLRRLVANLVSLSRMEEEQTALEMGEFSLSQTAAECVDSFAGMAEVMGKTLQGEIQPGLTVRGDLMTVGQLLSILCDNAVKYAVGTGNIQVRLYAAGKRIRFETENDWDQALPPEELAHLFDRFYRGDAARSGQTSPEGYGLGLSIASAIAEKNGLELTVRQTSQGRILFRVSFRRR